MPVEDTNSCFTKGCVPEMKLATRASSAPLVGFIERVGDNRELSVEYYFLVTLPLFLKLISH